MFCSLNGVLFISLPEYDAERLHKHVNSVLEKVCQAWVKTFPEFQVSGKAPTVSFHAIKNTRRKMEDRHVLVPDLNALFGIVVGYSENFPVWFLELIIEPFHPR